MKKKAGKVLIFFFVILIIVLAFSVSAVEDRFARYLLEKTQEKLKQHDVFLNCRKVSFSLVRGFSVNDFIVTAKDGKLIARGKKAVLRINFFRSPEGNDYLINKFLISGAEFNLETESGKTTPENQSFYKDIKTMIVTGSIINIYYSSEVFSLKDVFAEAFSRPDGLEGLLRATAEENSRLKLYFRNKREWSYEGEMNLPDATVLNKYRHLSGSSEMVFSAGKMDVSACGSVSPERKLWEVTFRPESCEIEIYNRKLSDICGEITLKPGSGNASISAKSGYTRFSADAVYSDKNSIVNLRSKSFYFKDISQIIHNPDFKIPSGMGSAEVELVFQGKLLQKASGCIGIGAAEFAGFTVENGRIPFFWEPGKIMISQSDLLFAGIWDASGSGEILLGEKIRPVIDFRCRNVFISDLVMQGKITCPDKELILSSQIGVEGFSIPFEFNFSRLPLFEGKIKTDFVRASWKGESFPQKKEWIVSSDFTLTPLTWGEGIRGNLHLKKNSERMYEIGECWFSDRWGKGDFSGVTGLKSGKIRFQWQGNTGFLRQIAGDDFAEFNAGITGEVSGGILNPVLSARVSSPDGNVSFDVHSEDLKLLFSGKAGNADLSGFIQCLEGNGEFEIRADKFIRIPPAIKKIMKEYGFSAEWFRGKMKTVTKGYQLSSYEFDLEFSNISFREQEFSGLQISGNGNKEKLVFEKFSVTLAAGGCFSSRNETVIDLKAKKFSGSILFSDAVISGNGYQGVFDGEVSFQNMKGISGKLGVSGKNLVIGDQKYDKIFFNGRFADGKLDVDKMVWPVPLFSGISGSGLYRFEKNYLILDRFTLKNDVSKIELSLRFNSENMSTDFFDLKIENPSDQRKLVLLKKESGFFSGDFDIDADYLKKVSGFDKIPLNLKGRLVKNSGNLEFSMEYGGETIRGNSSFRIEKNRSWHVTGEVEIRDSKIALESGEGMKFENLDFSPVTFNVKLKVGPKVWVKNPFLNSEIHGEFVLTGENYPGIGVAGEIKFDRGTVSYFSHKFEIVTGRVYYQTLSGSGKKTDTSRVIDYQKNSEFIASYIYTGKEHEIVLSQNESFIEGETNVSVSLIARKKIREFDVFLQISGPLSNLQLTAYSSPELEQTQLQKLLAGGAIFSTDGQDWNDRMMDTLKFNLREQLMGKVGENIARGLELEQFEIETSSDTVSQDDLDIRLGKYLSDKFYLQYQKKFRRYHDLSQFEVRYQTGNRMYLDGLYDEQKQDFQLGLQYSVNF